MPTVLLQIDTGNPAQKACRGFSAVAGSAVCQVVVTASIGSTVAAADAQTLHAHLSSALRRQHSRPEPTRCGDTFVPGADGCWARHHSGPVRRTLVWIVDAGGSPPAVPIQSPHLRPWTTVLPILPAGTSAGVLYGRVAASNARTLAAGGIAALVPDVLTAAGLGLDSYRVFISYRRADARAFADQLFDGLSHEGFDVYLDRFRTNPGANFVERIRFELADKACVVLLDSRDVRMSPWVEGEYGFARLYRLGLMAIDLPGGRRSFNRIGARLDLRRSRHAGAFGSEVTLSAAAVSKAVAFVRQRYHSEVSRRFRHQRELVRRAAALAGLPIVSWPDGLVEVTGPPGYVLRTSARPPTVEDFRSAHQSARRASATAPTSFKGVVVGPIGMQMQQARETTDWLARELGVASVDELRLLKALRRAAAGRL